MGGLGTLAGLATALSAYAVLSCGMGDGGGPAVTVEDSAGVRVVRSARPLWDPGEAWRLADSASLVIGEPPSSESADGTGGMTFRRIRVLLSLPDGRVVVANGSSPPELRLFSPRGRLLSSIGRGGEGPGEFGSIANVWWAEPDTLVVYDPTLLRMSWFSLETGFVEARPVQVPATDIGVPRRRLEGRFSDGTFLASPDILFPGRGGSGRMSWWALRVRPDGSVVDTLGYFPAFDFVTLSSGAVTPRLFGNRAGSVVDSTGYYRGIGDDFTVDHYDPTGRHLRRFQRAHRVQEASERMIETMLDRAEYANRDDARRVLRERYQPGPLPAYGRDWRIDREGHLWIPGYPAPSDSTIAWTVFGPQGRWWGEVEIDRRFRPMEIGSDYVLGVWMSELGVESVRRYRLEKPGLP